MFLNFQSGKRVVSNYEECNQKNYLEGIPLRNPDINWSVDEDGIVTLEIKNKGFVNRIAQKLFKKPRISHIALDEYGSFVWRQMDGKRSVYEISKLVEAHFGKKAEPVVERLVQFFRILYQNKFIGYVKEKKA